MEDSDTMTIEFLRARLLSERSVSKTERERADDLAKRVAELEEQLKFVTLQRKKAEKATSDVLRILENYGISDVSEGFGSCSDDEASPEFQACNGSVAIKEISTAEKFERNEVEAYSGSEFEYSQSTGRSLSWKSGKHSQYYQEKKKYADTVRRKTSVASNSSSPRRVGKSCRKVRHRETRSPEELQTNGLEQVTCGTDVSNCSDGEQYDLRGSSGYENEEKSTKRLSSNSKNRRDSVHYSSHEDMDSALQHQVQLIEQYEAEEKAQRELEDKFKENDVSRQNLCNLGSHSGVTEEPYDVKSPELSCCAPVLDVNNQQTCREAANARENIQYEDLSGTNAPCEKSASELSLPISKVEMQGKHIDASSSALSSSQLVVSSQETSNELGTVLEALQRAKLSLGEKRSTAPFETSTPEIGNKFSILDAYPGILRSPIDYQYQATMTRGHHITDEQFGFATSTPEIANNVFLSGRYDDSSERSLASLFRKASMGLEPGVPPSQPRLEVGPTSTLYGKMNQFDGSSYPYFQNTSIQSPLTEGAPRSSSNTEIGLPPIIRLPSYDDVLRKVQDLDNSNTLKSLFYK